MPPNTAIIDQAPTLVQRDAEGVPMRWRILPANTVVLTQDAARYELRLDAADIQGMATRAAGKEIPIDCDHRLYLEAAKLGLEESDPALTPIQGERLSCGHVTLSAEADGLWATVTHWTPRARLLLREGLYRYFSPVIRGLRDGALRLTSLALTNRPAILGLQPLVASDDIVVLSAESTIVNPRKKGTSMNAKMLALLCAVAGMNTIALSEDGGLPPDVDAALDAHLQALPTLRADHALVGKLRGHLALSDDAGAPVIEGKILALRDGAKDVAVLSAQLATIEAERTEEKREKLIATGTAAGKLTKAQIPWAKAQDIAVLSSYLDSAPVVAPVQRLDRGTLPAADEVKASATLEKVSQLFGRSAKDLKA